jgi:peroxiredoxin
MFMLIICALSFGAGQSKKLSPLPPELQGSAVPNFFMLAPDNETRLSKKGLEAEAKKLGAKRVVFSFFATWCLNCRAEFSNLKKSFGKLKEKGAQVYLIDVGEDLIRDGKKVGDFVKEYSGNLFPFYFDKNANLLKAFGLVDKSATEFSLPVIVVMDSDLRVLEVFTDIGDDFPQILWADL